MREVSEPNLITSTQVGGLADSVFENAAKAPDRTQLSRKVDGQWQDVSNAEFRDQVLALARGLLSQGVRFGDRVAIMSRTRYEWTIFDFALWSIGAQSVPVYPTASPEQLGWILEETSVMGCVVENEDHVMTLGSVIDRLPELRHVWQLDAGVIDRLVADGARISDDVVHRHRYAVTPDAVATIVFTSGTSGRPRGCVLTHGNFMSEVDNLIARWRPIFEPRVGEQHSDLLFLPLAHIFGRMCEVAAIRANGRLGHQPEMTSAALLPELAAFRPTFVLGVPYVFEKIFAGARAKAEADGKAKIFDRAVDVAVRYAEAREYHAFGKGPGPRLGLRVLHRVFDALVYTKIRAAMGGRVVNAVSGGSTMNRRLGLFFEGAGLTVYEGYGLTETTAAATANPPGRVRYGTVGRPIPGMSLRLSDSGEILLRGDTVFARYLDDPDGASSFQSDGWFATGDLGWLDDEGYLVITGRRKEIIVTASGKNLIPTQLEERVREHPLVENCAVIGNDRPYVAALITLDFDAMAHWLRLRGKPDADPHDLVRDPDLATEVRRAISAANTQVSKAESIRAFRILPIPFSEEQGLVTPSRKLRREAIDRVYAREIEALYRK